LRVSGSPWQGACACGGGCPNCRSSPGDRLQKRQLGTDAAAAAAPPGVREVLASPGQALAAPVRSALQPHFEFDLDAVQVHADARAGASARQQNALAYTVGRHIVFSSGAFVPATTRGRRLLAHELAHVGQQAAAGHSAVPRLQRKAGDGEPEASAATAAADPCADLRAALVDSQQVIALYKSFLAGDVSWPDMRAQTQMVGNAAQGVTGAGLAKPKIVQDAIAEVESFGFEEIGQMGSLALSTLPMVVGNDDIFQRQWVTNEIERQRHFNFVLTRLMYENACPDMPGTWASFQAQILPIGTKGSVPASTIGPPLKATRTALAWVEIADEHVLVLATETAGVGRLRFVQWIDAELKDLALRRAAEVQGAVPTVPGAAIVGLPDATPDGAARE